MVAVWLFRLQLVHEGATQFIATPLMYLRLLSHSMEVHIFPLSLHARSFLELQIGHVLLDFDLHGAQIVHTTATNLAIANQCRL